MDHGLAGIAVHRERIGTFDGCHDSLPKTQLPRGAVGSRYGTRAARPMRRVRHGLPGSPHENQPERTCRARPTCRREKRLIRKFPTQPAARALSRYSKTLLFSCRGLCKVHFRNGLSFFRNIEVLRLLDAGE